MPNSRKTQFHSNRRLYVIFWVLLGLVLSLSLSLLTVLSLILNPLIVRLNDEESVLIVVDPQAAERLNPILEMDIDDTYSE